MGQADGDGPADSDALGIGARLTELRSQHRYSIRRLAREADVSASLVSDVEKGKVEPSISTLKRLAAALGTTLAYFFSGPAQQSGRIVRAGERDVLGEGAELQSQAARSAIETSGVRFEIASPADATTIEAIYGRYEAGASLGDAITHEGEEWGMVLKGRLKVWVGEEIYFLDPGDAIGFHSTIPHRLENVSEDPLEYIWINTPKSF
ncbi:MAG TPA: cupin domain-containing protein [Solirubrobacterales bacterium]|jgi:transcriptional regulator with XRE-family HTH domain